MAFAITPLYWHVAGQTLLVSWVRNKASLSFEISDLGVLRLALSTLRSEVGNNCRIPDRQRLPGFERVPAIHLPRWGTITARRVRRSVELQLALFKEPKLIAAKRSAVVFGISES